MIILAIVILILLCLITVLVLIFRPIEGEEEIFAEYYKIGSGFNNYSNRIFTKAEFKEFKKATEEEIEEYENSRENAAIGDYTPPTGTDIKSVGNAEYDEVNSTIYAIAEKAWSGPGVKNIPQEYRNPNIILAQSITEYNDRTDTRKVLVPALPTKYMDDSDITVEKLKTFNVVDAFNLGSNYRAKIKSNIAHQGPLQMNLQYGIQTRMGYEDEGVIYKSEKHNIEAAGIEKVFPSQGWSLSNVRVPTYKNKNAGDRHNFNDAAILSVQYWDWAYGYASKRKDKRTERIKSEAAMVAFIGLNHNIGESVSTTKLSTDRSKMCKSKCTYDDLWDYIAWFNDPSVQADIREQANTGMQAYNNGKQISHLSDSSIRSIWSKYPNTISGKLVNEQAANHAMRIVYWYYVSEIFYKNGGNPL